MVVLSEIPEGSSSSHVPPSSTHGHSSSTDDHRYDVFLSFRGVDTRHSFTDHLHKALIDANINTFLDDEEIETGEDLKPELETAIKASQASIIVLSKNYAFSTWCLDELVLILEQRMTSNHIVIPIFYHVEPTHVRKQQSSFGDAMAKHKQTMEEETNVNKRSQWAQKMDRWNKALIEVANLKGNDANGRLETEFIEEVVKDIHRRLHIHLRSIGPQLIGMENHINFVTSWLKDASSHTTDILTIYGIGGIGKTSLAKHVYGLYSHEFHTSSYIEDITRKCNGKFNGLLDLQEQLCNDISKSSSIKVHDVSVYTAKIENALARKRVFLVLDDISTLVQLDALLGSKGFLPGSKVIITTKDSWLTESCSLFKTNIKPKHERHLLRGLDYFASLQLLCSHAFMCNQPKVGYEEVSDKLVMYCKGHPLALEVLGKSLHNRDVSYWEGCIKGLKKEISSPINNVLKMSFESLPSKNDKELFKHIACFFVGTDRDFTETILEACDINTRSGITNLIDRCLLNIGFNNELRMHQLVQEMGRFEVRQESLDKPWKRSRLWCHKESFRVLKQKKGKGNLVGLSLDMRMLEKEKLCASFELKTDAFNNMDKLRLLQLNYVHMNGSYENFPKEISWLCMHGYPLQSLPLNLPIQNLVALDLSYSNIKSFVGCYSNPQRFNVDAVSKNLLFFICLYWLFYFLFADGLLRKQFPNPMLGDANHPTSPLSHLYGIGLMLLLLYSNPQRLETWKKLDGSCLKEKRLLGSLKILNLSFCKQLHSLGEFDQLPALERLIVRNCIGLVEVCESIEQCVDLIFIDLSYCKKLERLPRNIGMLKNVKTMLLDGCSLGESQIQIRDTDSLELGKANNIDINTRTSSPAFVGAIPSDLKLFASSLPSSLVSLSLANSNLSTKSFPMDWSCLSMLKELYLDGNPINSMPSCVRTLPRLEILSMENCKKLKSVEHPPCTLSRLLFSVNGDLQGKVVFDPEMSPLELSPRRVASAAFSYEFEGIIKIQPMVCVEEKVLRSLGWSNLDFLNERHLGANSQEFGTQTMYYEFGIFSTKYEGEEMPSWFRHRSVGPSISFTIPSSSSSSPYNLLTRLNFCFSADTLKPPDDCFPVPYGQFPLWPMMTISNITKNRMWIYERYTDRYCVGGKCWVVLSHWMFGMNEMEAGDHVTITVTLPYNEFVKECGVSFVYDNGEEEDVLGYYKSWNHIIGGDLSPFQTTTGQYILNHLRFFVSGIYLFPYHHKFVPDGPDFQAQKELWFRALSPRKPGINGGAHEAYFLTPKPFLSSHEQQLYTTKY
ncbi:disease resistance protein RUN1 isoform X1 [Lactuca sativa]|uniref:disease resistance protein RUN1 isoform X1 n=1 Tax=Lactuca sativa TaxID=4236 RepID=UPI001C68AE2E|nr:disease resistance protein RUN1 isoform X1 [Lactuca sativa]XP_042758533.1 disease resistance protein RUN1 isoform X1 [Lactuca sativa]XP_042758537.1 disease resistance protein RUN1 isoform X1 [Lactuca sativa]